MGEMHEIKVPDIGDFDAVEVIEVLVALGDQVAVEDPLITVESDKASMDIPSPVAGTIKEVKVVEGDKLSEGDVIAIAEVSEGGGEETADDDAEPDETAADETAADEPAAGEATDDASEEGPEDAPAPAGQPGDQPTGQPAAAGGPIDEQAFSKAYASPAVRRFARELGVDLGKVEGSGRKGRILKQDVQGFVKRSLAAPGSGGGGGGAGGSGAGAGALALPPMPEIDFSRFGPVEEKPLSRIRKLSAANVHRSWLHVPHVTQHDQADVTAAEEFRKAHAAQAEERGVKLTPLTYLMRAAVAVLQEFPDFNSSLAPGGESLIVKRYYHLGIAVDTPDGLVVPVIRDVDQKGFFELAEELKEVSGRAREGKLKMTDLQGATFTISSLGGIGGTAFTPIVNAPEVAILGASRTAWKPVWQDGEFVPRLMLPLSLSYDHRVIDGATAARFITRLSQLLGDIRQLLL